LIFFLSRAGISGGNLDEGRLARVTFSAFAAVGIGILLAALEGFSVKGIFATVSAGIITPVFSYLLCGFYMDLSAGEMGERLSAKRRIYAQGASFALVYLFLYTLREVQVANVSLSFVLAVIFTLCLARTRGALYGAAAGMIGGMAQLSPSVAPALAVAGFFSGLFFEYSAYVAMMISFVAACGYCIYTEGLERFGFFTADFLCALAIFVPILYLLPGEKERKRKKVMEQDPFRSESIRAARQKLRSMSEAFSSLSEVFYTVGETIKKPKLADSSRLVSDCCAQLCSGCSLSGICWGREQASAVDATARVSAKLLATGKIEGEDFGEPFRTRCISLGKLVETINRRFGEINGSFLKNNKTRLLAGEYSSVSRLLKSTAGELDRELEYNPALESVAEKALKELGISYRRVAVFGNRELKIDVYGISVERVSHCAQRILESFEEAFSCRFAGPDFVMLEESVVMRLRKTRSLSLECAKSGCTKRGESVSGDHAGFFETGQDYFYTLICDGMGSGREAAFTSRLAAIFIEKLMHCATPKNVTLEMLNAFLMSKTDETFTTVDLLEIDLLSGEAHFIKAGAAPSYILRGERLHRIESRTPPAGVLRSMCAEQTTFRLLPGDFVILLSDGVEEGEENGALISLFAEKSFEN
ncbi:MAG: SpoIIE family protein phosphatase, partial [Clostridia bacterium]|nr:SpoIIE family protein phosphatase [Clostridia bacterium]